MLARNNIILYKYLPGSSGIFRRGNYHCRYWALTRIMCGQLAPFAKAGEVISTEERTRGKTMKKDYSGKLLFAFNQ